MTNPKGRFGIHGGQYIPETLMNAVIELEAAYDGEAGRLRISGLRVPGNTQMTAPEANLESWDLGRLEKGVFRAEKSYRRSFRYPALVDSLQIAPEEIPPAVMTTDAAGVRRGFVWNAETQKYWINK